MSVHIQFDQPESRCYTNLDFVTGRVVLVLPYDAAITAVTVKLEGESRTRLSGPKFPGNERSDKRRYELEAHKVRNKGFRIVPALTSTTAFVQSSYRFSHARATRQEHTVRLYPPVWTICVPIQFQGTQRSICWLRHASNGLISSHSITIAKDGLRRQ